MYSSEQIRELTDKVLNMAKADAVEVSFDGGERSATRWANSSITVNVVQYDQQLSINVRHGQKLTLDRMARLDSATGTYRPMNGGSLDNVDDFDWTDSETLRWRSRRLIDPPFNNTRITINGVPGSVRYLQFKGAGDRTVRVRAVRGAIREKAQATVHIAGDLLTFQTGRDASTTTQFARLRVRQVLGHPYRAVFSWPSREFPPGTRRRGARCPKTWEWTARAGPKARSSRFLRRERQASHRRMRPSPPIAGRR